MLTIEIERKAKLVSPFQTKLATNLIASRQFVFLASVKHCCFNVSACSPERKQDVEKNFEDIQGLTDELVVVVVQLLLRVPAVAIVGGVRHVPAIAWMGAPEMYVCSERLLVMNWQILQMQILS